SSGARSANVGCERDANEENKPRHQPRRTPSWTSEADSPAGGCRPANHREDANPESAEDCECDGDLCPSGHRYRSPLLRHREALVPPQWTPFPPFVVKARVTTSIQELRRPVSRLPRRRCVARLFAVPPEAIRLNGTSSDELCARHIIDCPI